MAVAALPTMLGALGAVLLLGGSLLALVGTPLTDRSRPNAVEASAPEGE